MIDKQERPPPPAHPLFRLSVSHDPSLLQLASFSNTKRHQHKRCGAVRTRRLLHAPVDQCTSEPANRQAVYVYESQCFLPLLPTINHRQGGVFSKMDAYNGLSGIRLPKTSNA